MGPVQRLAAEGFLEEYVPLGPLTTYRFGGSARYLLEAEGEADLMRLAEARAAEPIPLVVLGRGSNVVVSDRGFPGVVVHTGNAMSWCRLGSEGVVEAGGALPLPALARRSAEAGRGGLEFYVGIPGSVGGAVRMNAGCFGSETAEWLTAARVVHLGTAEAAERTPEDLDLAYRSSNLASDEVVVSASFSTVERMQAESEALIKEVTRWRKRNQPGGEMNAGSVFKNPPGDSAGRIIDSLGLKGLSVGGARVSERHANFFVAGAGASAQDVFDLVHAVRDRVRLATGIELEPEIKFIGPFGSDGS